MKQIQQSFGEISWEDAIDASLTTETKGFIGERYDADAGLQYLNARYYDPELALFIQPDWFPVTAPGVGTNRYSYSFNDPVNLRDPGGMKLEQRIMKIPQHSPESCRMKILGHLVGSQMIIALILTSAIPVFRQL